MTKKQTSERLNKLWDKLNSNVSKTEKMEVLSKISGIVHQDLHFATSMFDIYIPPCDLVIDEFKSSLQLNPNHVDTLKPSNLLWFQRAVKQSLLPE